MVLCFSSKEPKDLLGGPFPLDPLEQSLIALKRAWKKKEAKKMAFSMYQVI